MLKKESAYVQKETKAQMEIWNNPNPPSFMFQQYRTVDENQVTAYEALAILKNADGSSLANNLYFDQLRNMDSEWQISVDRYLVPLAIKAAADKKRLPVAINVHVATLCDDKFLSVMYAAINAAELKKSDVMFEIVEPHVPTRDQVRCLEKLSARMVGDQGFVLIIDDHDFETGDDRLERLAPVCDMVKIDKKDAKPGVKILQDKYAHLSIVVERVTFNDRQNVFADHPGVLVQGI